MVAFIGWVDSGIDVIQLDDVAPVAYCWFDDFLFCAADLIGIFIDNRISAYSYHLIGWIPEAISFLCVALPDEETSDTLCVKFATLCIWYVNKGFRSKDTEMTQVWLLSIPHLVGCLRCVL